MVHNIDMQESKEMRTIVALTSILFRYMCIQ